MNRSLLFRMLLMFVVLEAIVLLACFWYASWRQQAYLADEYTELASHYRSALETSEVLSKALFGEILNKQPVISLVSRAVDADAAQRNILRNELARQVQPTYRTLLQYNMNQLHFHLPDVSSFLRMHRPGIFGDSLVAIRPAVVLANQRRDYVSGFEIGRHEAGFRFIFPLFDHQRFIGTVETSISYNRFQEQLNRRFPGNYSLLVKRSVVDARLIDQEKLGLVVNPLSPHLMEASRSEANHPLHVPADLFNTLADRLAPYVGPLLERNQPIYQASFVQGRGYALYLMPITNVSGQTESYLLKLVQDRNLDTFRMTSALMVLVATLLVLLLCSYLFMRAQRNHKLQEANRLFHAAIDALPYPFQIIDTASHRILVANRATDVSGSSAEGLTCYAVTHGSDKPCDDPAHPCPLVMAQAERRPVVVEHIHRNDAGEDRIVEVHGYPILEADGNVSRCIEYAIDVTERKEMQEQLVLLAETDALTGAWSRRKFYDLLHGEMNRSARYNRPLVLLMMDLDHFKQINDTFGHDVGDNVLQELVKMLKTQLRAIDVLARSGGEEFLVLAPETTLESGRLLAEKLVQASRSHRYPRVDCVRLSIGVAAYQQNDSLDDLLKRADQALYRAKNNGRDRWEG